MSACLYPICSCYPDTSSRCDMEECTWPHCACNVPPPADGYTRCMVRPHLRRVESGGTWWWECSDRLARGYGINVRAAYDDWVSRRIHWGNRGMRL